MNRKVPQATATVKRGRPVEIDEPIKIKTTIPRAMAVALAKKYPHVATAKAIRLAIDEACAK